MGAQVPPLETPRLQLPPLTLADAPAIQALFPRWEIVRYLADHIPWPYPEDGAHTHLRDSILPAMAEGREWHWSLRPRSEPGRLIGVLSLTDRPDDNRGFWLDPAWQGRGLMTEACEAANDFWFGVLQRPVLRVPKATANHASVRLSERMGMRRVRTEEKAFVSGRLPAELWELTRETWKEQRARPAHGQ